ncbi:MAG: NAD-dependent epimerase/dehydratase family protein [Candidatus Binatia bacterium]
MARVLVTGGTGFVGANLVRRLLDDGHAVHLVVRPGSASWRIAELAGRVAFHAVALTDADAVTGVVRDVRPEWVFHLATHGAYSWETDVRRMIETTVLGTMHLVQACLAVGFLAFVNTGSSSEYGWKDHPPAETEALDPNSHYAVNKAWATHFCRYTALAEGAPIRTLRLYSVYGPWEEPRRLIPTLVVRGMAGVLPPLVGPDVARDYVYVGDVCEAYLRVAAVPEQPPGAVYNVGTGVQTTLREAVDVVRSTLGITAEPVWGTMPPRRWDTTVWLADVRRITSLLGWRAETPFAAGFARTVEWFRADPMRRAFYAERQAAVA